MNNKGFAISIMLYSFTILMISIFFIYFYIIKNRYTNGSELIDNIVYDININDHTGTDDQVGPLIMTDNEGFANNGAITVRVTIVDDVELNNSSVEILLNNSSTICDNLEMSENKFMTCTVSIPNTEGSYILRVYAEDMTGNPTSSIDTNYFNNKLYYTQAYNVDKSAPSCNFLGPYNSDGEVISEAYFGNTSIYYLLHCQDSLSPVNLANILPTDISGNMIEVVSVSVYEPDQYHNTIIDNKFDIKPNDKTLLITIQAHTNEEYPAGISTNISINRNLIKDAAGNPFDNFGTLVSSNILFKTYYVG